MPVVKAPLILAPRGSKLLRREFLLVTELQLDRFRQKKTKDAFAAERGQAQVVEATSSDDSMLSL